MRCLVQSNKGLYNVITAIKKDFFYNFLLLFTIYLFINSCLHIESVCYFLKLVAYYEIV